MANHSQPLPGDHLELFAAASAFAGYEPCGVCLGRLVGKELSGGVPSRQGLMSLITGTYAEGTDGIGRLRMVCLLLKILRKPLF